MEKWKSVVGYEGEYEVSDLGNVRSLDRVNAVKGRWGKVEQKHYKGKRLANGKAKNGYNMVSLNSKSKYTHHLVLEAFIGPRPEGMEACHNNGKRDDNRLENLRWDTPSNNQMDRREHGTSNTGERHGRCTISEIHPHLSLKVSDA